MRLAWWQRMRIRLWLLLPAWYQQWQVRRIRARMDPEVVQKAVDEMLEGLVIAQPEPPPPLTVDEIRRIAADLHRIQPLGDHVAMAGPTLDYLTTTYPPRPAAAGPPPLYGLRVEEDPSLPNGVFEVRDGSRLLAQYAIGVGDRVSEQVAALARRAEVMGIAVELGEATTETIHRDDGSMMLKVKQPYRFVQRPTGPAELTD